MGGKNKPQNQSGLSGLASSLLGGGHNKPTSQSGSGGIGGLAGQLVGSMFAEKPHAQQQQPQSSGYGGSSGSGQQGGGGLMGFLGGHHGSSVRIDGYFWKQFKLMPFQEPG